MKCPICNTAFELGGNAQMSNKFGVHVCLYCHSALAIWTRHDGTIKYTVMRYRFASKSGAALLDSIRSRVREMKYGITA